MTHLDTTRERKEGGERWENCIPCVITSDEIFVEKSI
jgi:hypothetical protein